MTPTRIQREPDEWQVWSPGNESEESRFCDLVCVECTKNSNNEAGWPIGCEVLNDSINNAGEQILFNAAKGKIKCQKQQLKGQKPQFRCKQTPDMFGADTLLQIARNE